MCIYIYIYIYMGGLGESGLPPRNREIFCKRREGDLALRDGLE